MKKKNNFAKDFIKKQYAELILFNLIAFFAILILLGVLAITSINNTFFNNIKKDIIVAEENIKESLEYSAESDRLIVRNNNNARIMMIFYTNDEVFRYYSSNLLSMSLKIMIGFHELMMEFSVRKIILIKIYGMSISMLWRLLKKIVFFVLIPTT